MTFPPGALVSARGRDWVVLPESTDEFLIVRPLGGTDDEIGGIHVALEQPTSASFPPPDSTQVGDFRSSRLLRDALRLGFRSSAGPFRSFGSIAVEPRPYQLVPLLLALRQETVRLLIADDVGIGKTIEASLVAKELLEQGDATRLCVLCPPHLCDQWQAELHEKFHIDAVTVASGTAPRLERNLLHGESLFDRHPHVIVSVDFIKSDRRRDDFIRACPNLVIVDEAHQCADDSGGKSGMQRHELLRHIAAKPERHLILVTATPHSGKKGAFRTLVSFLDESLANLPESLAGPENTKLRENLGRFMVQRRRGDIRALIETTPFPDRETSEATYSLSPEYRRLLERVLAYCGETIRDPHLGQHRQRVRFWAALGMLRALASSPRALAATLRSRAATTDTETPEEADLVGRRTILDLETDDAVDGADAVPGADTDQDDDNTDDATRARRRLSDLARAADALEGGADAKLTKATALVRELLAAGHNPILFCRFIPTAEYVAEHLTKALGGQAVVEAITGRIPASERATRVDLLAASEGSRVLVATDCLSEGINLQQAFDAVVHYDLAWSPTRHEQREGRVDRYNQSSPTVRTVTYWGTDTKIDGIVLDVLLRKHQTIRQDLGISVPIPEDPDSVMTALLEGLLLRGRQDDAIQDQLALFDRDVVAPRREELHTAWQLEAERERRSQTYFAQASVHTDEIASELAAARQAIGSHIDVREFLTDALTAAQATITLRNNLFNADLTETPRALRDALGTDHIKGRFEPPTTGDEQLLGRTHPAVEALAALVLDTSLDPDADHLAARCGVIRTDSVKAATTILLLRLRHRIITRRPDGSETDLLAEEARITAFHGDPATPTWLDDAITEALLNAKPVGNVGLDQAAAFTARVVEALPRLQPHLADEAHNRAEELLATHRRIRQRTGVGVRGTRVETQGDPDVLGIYVLLPAITI